MLLRHEGFRRLCHARDLLRDADEPRRRSIRLAREVRMSPFHFIRQFEAVFGVTPHHSGSRRGSSSRKHCWPAVSHSVTDVCMEVGFSSLGSFSALFARRDREIAVSLPATHQDAGVSTRRPCQPSHARVPQPDGDAAPAR